MLRTIAMPIRFTKSKASLLLVSLPVMMISTLAAILMAACTQVPVDRPPTPTTRPEKIVTLSLAGKMDAQGRLSEDLELSSDDGYARLFLTAGAMLAMEGGRPPENLSVTLRPLKGIAYEFQPVKTGLSPPARLQICYDPDQLLQYQKENKPMLGVFQETQASWSWLDIEIDPESPCVSAAINHLGTFVLAFDTAGGPMISLILPKDF